MSGVADPFDIERLGDDDPFEIDEQVAHLFKHPRLGLDDIVVIVVVWRNDPIFYPEIPPAHWPIGNVEVRCPRRVTVALGYRD